jgi:hypothetical protein
MLTIQSLPPTIPIEIVFGFGCGLVHLRVYMRSTTDAFGLFTLLVPGRVRACGLATITTYYPTGLLLLILSTQSWLGSHASLMGE